ncbi:MAG: lipoprotein-releasing ABC transporter permease subunit [Proteobacteria bacterium]|nr:lipoprotein-releasing ABC transporter permease subunit [Pseudomonadota bacterium]
MFSSFETMIGLRYVRARRRNHFISFISMTSMLGLGLGVMALITVLSVMNGFEKELKERILGMASHATITEVGNVLNDWQPIAEEVLQHPGIIGVAPYFHAEGMLVKDKRVNGTIIRGILPAEEPKVSVVAEKIKHGDLNDLQAGDFNIVLGKELARKLGVFIGDKVTLVVPQANVTPAGILPRLKRFTLVGIFEVGMHEFDSALALIHMDDALKLFRKTGPTGLRLKTSNILMAPVISREIVNQLPGHYRVEDWTQRHRNFFRALATEKMVMFVILTLIVVVAAFNIISTLVMMVSDKQADIAVLRTLGASPGSILKIFMVQGTVIGLVGIILGIIAGVLLASNIETIVPAIEFMLGREFLPGDVYYISDVPSDMRWSDVISISIISFLLSLLATIYPALRAAKTQPAEALRYE